MGGRLASSSNASCAVRRFQKRRSRDLVAVGKTRFFPGDPPDPDAPVNAVRAFLDDPIFQRPGFMPCGLKKDIGGIDAGAQKMTHDPLKVPRS